MAKKNEPSKVGKVLKVTGALVAAGLVGGALGFGGFSIMNPTPEVPVAPVCEPVIETVTEYVDVPVEVSVEVPVVNPVNGIMEDFIQDEVDSDIDADYVVFEHSMEMDIEAFITESFITLLDDEEYGIEAFDEELDGYRKSEVSLKDLDLKELDRKDIDDKDLDFVYELKVKAKESGESSEYFSYEITVEVRDGTYSMDDVSIELME